MATVYVGKRLEQAQGNYSIHRGTLEYLTKIGAQPIRGTAKEVPDNKLGPEGQYEEA